MGLKAVKILIFKGMTEAHVSPLLSFAFGIATNIPPPLDWANRQIIKSMCLAFKFLISLFNTAQIHPVCDQSH